MGAEWLIAVIALSTLIASVLLVAVFGYAMISDLVARRRVAKWVRKVTADIEKNARRSSDPDTP